jgi:predicted ATPase/DNA-binding CsgD family transcriptional regulator
MMVAAMAPISSRVPEQEGEHNVPAPLSSLVGRVRELDAIGETLRRTRLVTLTGPGGVGKTRLALELGRRQVGRRAGGVWVVDLAARAELPDVASESARVLSVGVPAGASAAAAVCRYVADREVLLVLDNCERVVEACAELTATLLGSCGNVRVLATSRELLGVSGETVWRVDPLGTEEARRLFVERARQRRPELIPDGEDEATIERLCARLDRLPLAIELAAARVGVMSLAEILAGLEGRLGELAGAERFAPAHHRTLRATVEWSYQLLEASEREAFRSLAVFVGGFDAAAAMAVAPELSVDLLARLVDKSLVAPAESPAGRTSYRMLDTVHEYAYRLLVDADELDAARERHLRHFARFARSDGAGWFRDAGQLVSELHDDYENVRAALEWAAASDPCAARPLLAGMNDLFQLLGQADGLRLAQLLLERCARRDRQRAEVQLTAGTLAMLVADMDGARSALADANKLSVELGERALEGWARFFLGLSGALAGVVEPAREHLEVSRAIHEELGIRAGWAVATGALGVTYLNAGEPAPARELVDDALAASVAADYAWGQGQCHIYLGMIAESSGKDPAGAAGHYRQAADALRPFRGGPLLPVALVGQAGVLARHDPQRALRVAAAAYALRERVGGRFPPFFGALAERARGAAEAGVGAESTLVWKEGARLSLDEAIALAFGGRRPHRELPAGLSEREAEIACLVADGLPNKAIAANLHLSVRTVESHVRHVLGKVGLQNRTQLATWARERIQ